MMPAVATINNLGSCAHNPRGNLWFNDESTFGHKLLMKMGWSKGKGLGKKEDGIKENLSVKFRSTNSGLGYKDDSYANVMKTEYESILKKLSSNYSENGTCGVGKKNKEKSCGQKSRVVKSRLRYPKLFFGKDVSKYSETDMKSIFICSLPSKDKQEVVEGSALSKKQKSESASPKVAETYCSTLSISDYFANKMKEKKSNALAKGDVNDLGQQQCLLTSEITEADSLSTLSSRKLSKKKEKKSEINQESMSLDLQKTELGLETTGTIDILPTSCKKELSSGKKRKKSEISTNIAETDIPHIDDREEECIVPNKKNRKLSDSFCKDNVSEICETSKNNSCSPDKKRRKSEVYKNSSVDIHVENENKGKISCQIELSSDAALQLKKKQNKRNKKRDMDAEEYPVDNSQVTDALQTSYSKKKKKKLKKMKLKKLKSCLKMKSSKYSIKNVTFNENVSYRVIDTDFESVDCLSDACSGVQTDLINEVFGTSEGDKSECGDNASVTQEMCSDDLKCDSDSVAEVEDTVPGEEDLKEDCSSSGLPSPQSSHYNFWVESQRQALKMKIYKSMLKSIKKHKILKTSNLLSIKGYGNWGFK